MNGFTNGLATRSGPAIVPFWRFCNQNRLGATLASIYSVRPTPEASVSTPVTWDEVERGIETADFTLKNVPKRIAKIGDLWKPLTQQRGRYDLQKLLTGANA